MIQMVGLVIPDEAQELIEAGKLVRTNGILRDAETMEIVKHLILVDLDNMNDMQDAAQEAIEAGKFIRTDGIQRNIENKYPPVVDLEDKTAFQELGEAIKRTVKENKKTFIIGAGVAVVGIGGLCYLVYKKHKARKDIEEKCNTVLNRAIKNYIDAAQNAELDINTIEACEDALSSIPQITEKVFISMTKEQILGFTNGIKEYTVKLAEDNNYEIEEQSLIEYKDNVVSFMVNNLRVQKDILQKCA